MASVSSHGPVGSLSGAMDPNGSIFANPITGEDNVGVCTGVVNGIGTGRVLPDAP